MFSFSVFFCVVFCCCCCCSLLPSIARTPHWKLWNIFCSVIRSLCLRNLHALRSLLTLNTYDDVDDVIKWTKRKEEKDVWRVKSNEIAPEQTINTHNTLCCVRLKSTYHHAFIVRLSLHDASDVSHDRIATTTNNSIIIILFIGSGDYRWLQPNRDQAVDANEQMYRYGHWTRYNLPTILCIFVCRADSGTSHTLSTRRVLANENRKCTLLDFCHKR